VIALFPADATARLHILNDHSDCPFAVIIARPPLEPVPTNLLRPGKHSTILTHDRDLHWPDRHGEMLAATTLEAGGVVLMGFARLTDAMACHAKLTAA
jgi:hypothetical protein